MILKFIWKFRECKIGKNITKRENKIGGLALLDFKTYLKLQSCREHGIDVRQANSTMEQN